MNFTVLRLDIIASQKILTIIPVGYVCFLTLLPKLDIFILWIDSEWYKIAASQHLLTYKWPFHMAKPNNRNFYKHIVLTYFYMSYFVNVKKVIQSVPKVSQINLLKHHQLNSPLSSKNPDPSLLPGWGTYWSTKLAMSSSDKDSSVSPWDMVVPHLLKWEKMGRITLEVGEWNQKVHFGCGKFETVWNI